MFFSLAKIQCVRVQRRCEADLSLLRVSRIRFRPSTSTTTQTARALPRSSHNVPSSLQDQADLSTRRTLRTGSTSSVKRLATLTGRRVAVQSLRFLALIDLCVHRRPGRCARPDVHSSTGLLLPRRRKSPAHPLEDAASSKLSPSGGRRPRSGHKVESRVQTRRSQLTTVVTVAHLNSYVLPSLFVDSDCKLTGHGQSCVPPASPRLPRRAPSLISGQAYNQRLSFPELS